MWRAVWMFTNRGQLRWIDDWIIQWRGHRYQRWWKFVALWFTALAIKAPFITRIRSLPTLIFPVLFLWRLPIPFGFGMMNAMWVCGGVVCLLFCLLMSIKMWEPNFWRDNCSHVWFSVPGIKFIASFLSQYNPNLALKYDLSEKDHYFTVHISYLETKINENKDISIWESLSAARIDIFQFINKRVFYYNTYTKNWVPLTGNCDSH